MPSSQPNDPRRSLPKGKTLPTAKPVAPAVAQARPAQVKPVASNGGSGSLKFAQSSPHERIVARRKKKSLLASPLLWGLVLLLAVGGAGAAYYLQQQQGTAAVASANSPDAPATAQGGLAGIGDQKVQELSEVSFVVPGAETAALMELQKGPEGAKFDANTGRFSWTPTEAQGPGEYQMTLVVDQGGQRHEKPLTITVSEVNEPPTIETISDLTLNGSETQELVLTAKASDTDLPAQQITFDMAPGAPAGVQINPSTGELRWAPGEMEPGKVVALGVRATDNATPPASSVMTFNVRLEGFGDPAKELAHNLEAAGLAVKMVGYESKPLFSGESLMIEANGGRIRTYRYADAAATNVDAAKVSRDAMRVNSVEMNWTGPTHFFKNDRLIAYYTGMDETVLQNLSRLMDAPFATTLSDAFLPGEALASTDSGVGGVMPADGPPPSELEQALLDLHKRKQLFVRKEYATLRKLYADAFAREQVRSIEMGFGEDHYELMQWLDQRPEVKEEFFTAVDPANDRMVEVFALFRDLWKQYPKQIEKYWELAVATSLVWDNDRGVYEYTGHQTRAKAPMPATPLLAAVDNFKYFIDAESVMQGRAQLLPWEFLIHLVNHRTPVEERVWAVQNYVNHRAMFGDCYHDVPYDYEMLRTGSQSAKMNGHEYTLANLKEFGGVCAHQADYAARIGKSMGVPAVYVSGEGNSLGLHAWVMWVELKQVTPASINFTLESHGRYNIDNYYVGQLRDPQTGQGITDRDLELRLQTVGLNKQAKRHAVLLMKSFPTLRDRLEMNTKDQIQYLSDVITLCPGNEEAWTELASLSAGGKIEKQHRQAITVALDTMFRTFQRVPDFTWKIFDDFISFQDDMALRLQAYEKLTLLYEAAERPDLACEARLKLAEYQVKEEKGKEAVEGLAFTIKKFPDEGRYVPRMLDRLEEVCAQFEGSEQALLRFYREFLPTVPKTRAGDPSDYCIQMYERGIKKFRELGDEATAAALEQELVKIRKGEVT